LVLEYQSAVSHRPTIFLIDEQSVEVLFRTALLFDPGLSTIAGTENYAAASDDPAFVVADELNTQKRATRRTLDFCPCAPAVVGSQDGAFLSNGPALFFIAKIDVIERHCSFRLLPGPGFTGVFGIQDRAARADDPATLLVDKIDVNQLLIRWRVQHLPRRTPIARDRENTINYLVVAAGRANDPTTFPSIEAQAVKLRRRAVEF